MATNYAMATIRLPIELFENGQYEIYSDRVSIQIEPCDVLPEKSEYKNEDLLEKIFSMSKNGGKPDESFEELVVYSKSIRRTPKRRQNLTFALRPKSHNYTKHNYPPISSSTSTADSHQSLSELD
jgi:hypothetical protein